MPISNAEFEAMQARTLKAIGKLKPSDAVQLNEAVPVARERDLHDALIEYYAHQWPRWKVIYARQDKRSTIPAGCQDHTVFASNGRVFCFELKRKNEKPDRDQLIWHKEMEMLGHKVHVIRSEQEFLNIVKLLEL